MTHLPYIVAAYALGAVGILWLSVGASLRLARAKRRQAAVDPRAQRAGFSDGASPDLVA